MGLPFGTGQLACAAVRLADAERALRDLAEGRWVRQQLGVQRTDQQKLFYSALEVPLVEARRGRLFWPDEVRLSIQLEWLDPVPVEWLTPIRATLARPVNLCLAFDNEPLLGLAGLLLCPNWTDGSEPSETEEEAWVIPLPDERGRVVRWHGSALMEALCELENLWLGNLDDIVQALALEAVDDEP